VPINYLAMMVPFAGICAGIAIAFFAIWTNHRRKMLNMRSKVSAEMAMQNAAHIQELKQRLQTVERIVTDSGFDISRQIEDLREASETKQLN